MDTKVIYFDGEKYKAPSYLKGGRYRIISILAKGGMGLIYEANDTQTLNKKVLIKSLIYKPSLFENKNDVNRAREIESIRQMAKSERIALLYAWERNIGSVPILLDYFEDFNPSIYGPHVDKTTSEQYTVDDIAQNEPYIVINYFSGTPFSKKDISDNESKLNNAKKVCITMCKILKSFHQQYRMPLKSGNESIIQFIYCDLKPSNIIQCNDRRIVLIDFGSFVKKIDGNTDDSVIATPGYCAPEVNTDIKETIYPEDISPAVDVYSLGATLYEIITGKAPLYSASDKKNLFDMDAVESIDTGWMKFLQKALSEQTDYRFKNMHEMLSGYFNIVEGLPENQNNSPEKEIRRFAGFSRGKPLVAYNQNWEFLSVLNEERKFLKTANIQKKEMVFIIKAYANHLIPEKINQYTNIKNKSEKNMLHPFMLSIMKKSAEVFSRNISYCPELILFNLESDIPHIVFKLPHCFPFLKPKSHYYNRNYLIKRIFKIINMFEDMEKRDLIVIDIDNDDVLFDISDQPYIGDGIILSCSKNDLWNPLLDHIIKKQASAPEIIKEKEFSDKTFSYLAGKLVAGFLMDCNNIDHRKWFKDNPFPTKAQKEKLAGTITDDGILISFLNNTLALDPSMRSTLFELKRLLSDTDLTAKSGRIQNRGYTSNKISMIINNSSLTQKYYVNYSGMYNDIKIRYSENSHFESKFILHFEPKGAFLNLLKEKNSKYTVCSKDQLGNILLQHLDISEKDGTVALVFDKSIYSVKDEIREKAVNFKRMYLFAPENPFLDIKNICFFKIDSYLKLKQR